MRRPLDDGPVHEYDEKAQLVSLLSSHCEAQKLEEVRKLAETCAFEELVEHIYSQNLVPPWFASIPKDAPFIRRLLSIRHATNRAVSKYVPIRLDVPTWFFQAGHNENSALSSWNGLLGAGTREVFVPGNHVTMMMVEENRRQLATAIQKALLAPPETSDRRENSC